MARGKDARAAGVMDLAWGKDARAAGVMDLAWGKDARAAGVVDLARERGYSPPPLTEVLYCALIADVI